MTPDFPARRSRRPLFSDRHAGFGRLLLPIRSYLPDPNVAVRQCLHRCSAAGISGRADAAVPPAARSPVGLLPARSDNPMEPAAVNPLDCRVQGPRRHSREVPLSEAGTGPTITRRPNTALINPRRDLRQARVRIVQPNRSPHASRKVRNRSSSFTGCRAPRYRNTLSQRVFSSIPDPMSKMAEGGFGLGSPTVAGLPHWAMPASRQGSPHAEVTPGVRQD